jgi:sugar/nucleoside kinase (ribokinase family)
VRFDVTLVGEFNMDLLLYGLPESLPPEREFLANRMALLLGGSSAITAHNLAALGNRVGLITCAADDHFAASCLSELSAAGVDLSSVVPAPAEIETGVTVLLQHERSRRTLTYLGATGALTYRDLDLEYLKKSRHFHMCSPFLQRGLLPDLPRLLAELKQAGLSISMDTNDDPAGEWAGPVQQALESVDVLMPNEYEACQLAGTATLDEAILKLLERVPLLVIKQGARGALACSADHTESVSAVDVKSLDAVGAGDSFNAGFLHGYVRGWPHRRCLELGNLAGALSTTGVGGTAAFRNGSALKQFLGRNLVEDHEQVKAP